MAGTIRGSKRRTTPIVGILAVALGLTGLLTAPAAGASTRGAARHREPGLASVRKHLAGPAASRVGLLPDRPALSGRPGPGRAWPTTGGPASTGASAPAGGSWQIQPARSAITPNGFVYATSCPTTSACISVGSYENGNGTEVSLAQVSTGTAWRTVATPNPPGAEYTKLFGVSCLAADECTAAGYSVDFSGTGHPLAEQWNGTSWRIQATPGVTGSNNSGLFAISCAAANACLAVGATRNVVGTTTPLAETWNGTAWQVVTVPVPNGSTFNQFLSVSCSSATACTAGGVTGTNVNPPTPLAERWNGTSWQIQATPPISGATGAEFDGISCPASRSCIAVGDSGTEAGNEATLAETWNGTSWTFEATQVPENAIYNELYAVSCTAPDACTAGGYASFIDGRSIALANRWDGTSWQLQTTPGPPPDTLGTGYEAVSCSGAAACIAAGVVVTRSNQTLSLVASWQGTSWQAETAPDSGGAAGITILGGVSCPSASDCVTVGFFDDNKAVAVPLAERWDGTSWQIQPTPLPATLRTGTLSTVSCTSASACTTVGSYFDTSTRQTVTLAERWDGTSWQIQPTPDPAGAIHGSSLGGVSCATPDACMAVGNYHNGVSSLPFAETWDGTSWTVQTIPVPAKGGYVGSVSCTSPSDCVGVGGNESYIWNGTAWRYQRAARPADPKAVSLNSVSCSSASSCTAVGSDSVHGVKGLQTLAEDWNGTQWTIQTTPNKARNNTLYSVSCTSASACMAIGVYEHGGQPQFADAEAWNGTSWTLETLPLPPGAEASVLFGVSCLVSGCTATGASIASLSRVQLALALHTSA